MRTFFLRRNRIRLINELGANPFQKTIGSDVILTVFNSINRDIYSLDLSKVTGPNKNAVKSKTEKLVLIDRNNLLNDIEARITLQRRDTSFAKLESCAKSFAGILNGDTPRFNALFWEVAFLSSSWEYLQSTISSRSYFSGKSGIILWEKGQGQLKKLAIQLKERLHSADMRGNQAWGKKGIAVSQMGNLYPTLYNGNYFDSNVAILIPIDEKNLIAVWAYCNSENYNEEVRKIDKKKNVTNATLVKVPFDLEYWKQVAEEKYPNGLPKPFSDDPTQWLFHGHPAKANNSLQVAVSRLLGYRWPAENDCEMELADEAKVLVQQIKAFDVLTDEDGILCIPPVNGELGASERLRCYLQEVYGSEWSNNTISQLLTREGSKKSNLEDWIREEFFEQHNKLFQNRPFIWHIWDGRKDGFAALVNYHKLDKENLKRLIFTYLGDWIRQCEAKKKSGESGAEGLLSATLKLKEKLEAILEGENPYDIFVRWKSLDKQAIGWEPDLNDGVRLNIRPFITADVLRKKPNIKWGVDRGKNPPGSFWGEVRDNDLHKSLEEKRNAREK